MIKGNLSGYYRNPTIFEDQIAFLADDDIWLANVKGGSARRLTSSFGKIHAPSFSPDGEWLAFSGRDEGHSEVYVMPASGGTPKRLTYLGSPSVVCGWDPRTSEILFSTSDGQPFRQLLVPHRISLRGGLARDFGIGPANHVSISAEAPRGVVIQRGSARDPSHWKRYRGGTTGDLWVDSLGKGNFTKLTKIAGNHSRPFWAKGRIYFVSDHEGFGNLYSCLSSGKDLKRHTHHDEYYVRNPSTDGNSIVYHSGGDLFILPVGGRSPRKVDVDFDSPRMQRKRKYVSASDYLEEVTLHPGGHSLGVVARGKPFTLGNWEGSVIQHGVEQGVRYRMLEWLPDGKRFVATSDASGDEVLYLFHADARNPPKALTSASRPSLGRLTALVMNPVLDQVAVTNHRCELWVVDLKTAKATKIDQSKYGLLQGLSWSGDGRWLAYSRSITVRTTAIFISDARGKQRKQVTRPLLKDFAPAFDPDGKFLYLLSAREFDPVYDNLHFDLGFPRGIRPYLITLRKDILSPFVPVVKPLESAGPDEKLEEKKPRKKKKDGIDSKKVDIDFEGIEDRLLAFPVWDGRHVKIEAGKNRVFYAVEPVEGTLESESWADPDTSADLVLFSYEFETLKPKVWLDGISDFGLSADRSTMWIRVGNRIKVVKAGEKPEEDDKSQKTDRKTGWIDLDRIRLNVDPGQEWRQMYLEAWRLQRDHFWTEKMSGVDWNAVRLRYLPLIDRIATRDDFSDLIWEMQGELGTSHAYEMGGDYRAEPHWGVGKLGAKLKWIPKAKAFQIKSFAKGDVWTESAGSPLLKPGVNLEIGDWIESVNGRSLAPNADPGEHFLHLAGQEVTLGVKRMGAKSRTKLGRTVQVQLVRSEMGAYYRDWVERNREFVHQKSKGAIGYVHIPDMGPVGYSEFHRYFLSEIDRNGLIVDVRFNGGGHVSQLILEKLARKRLGYDKSRWTDLQPYPNDSVEGPMAALTNEFAGSDGDIFSHCFKLMKLGPLIGKRTWGGVIGIWPRHSLVDGSMTTQPEFSFWFKDVGWGIENHGAIPDMDVEIGPSDYAKSRDPQLERGVAEVIKALKKHKEKRPDLKALPNLAPPGLRRRT